MDLKKTLQKRFNSLAGERKNLFSSSKQRHDSNFDDNSSSKQITSGPYMPPSKRNTNKSSNGKQQNSKTQGIILPDAEDKLKAPTQVPDIGNKELFPSLGSDIIIVEKPIDETEKPSFTAIATDKEESPKVQVEKETLKPGWVKLFIGPNGEFMREDGPPLPESPYIKRLKEYEERLARQLLIDTLERNIAYTREMDPYGIHYDLEEEDEEDEEEELIELGTPLESELEMGEGDY